MKINFTKTHHGGLWPSTDMEEEKMTRFKTGEIYEIEIKQSRNNKFHGKVFRFLNFVFKFWRKGFELHDEHVQFDRFRKDLTILAGYRREVFNYKGDLRLEAQSISYSSMSQDEFEGFYNALINASIKHVLQDADENTINQLYSFFH